MNITKDEFLLLCAHIAGQDEQSSREELATFLRVAARARFNVEDICKKIPAGHAPAAES